MKRDIKGRFIKGSNGDLFEGYGKWYDKFGYPYIFVDGKNVMLHHYIWERYNRERPKGFHIHHIDGDKKNYNIENLLCVSPGDHQKIHANWKKNAKGDWAFKPCKDCKKILPLDNFYPRKGLTPSNRCKPCSSLHYKALRTPEFIARRKQYLKEYYKKNKEKYVKQRKK
jgi:hypothetical protein